MENKKLLKYLLKDLSELDEMFSEKGKNSFDDFEMEFIQNRVTGAKRLIQLFFEHENDKPAEFKSDTPSHQKTELQNLDLLKVKSEIKVEEKTPKIIVEEKVHETAIEEKIKVAENEIKVPEIAKVPEMAKVTEVVIHEKTENEVSVQEVRIQSVAVQQELQMDDEEPVDIHNKRLGDSFLKEKSVNDLMSDDFSKLEHKLSNRPVSSIQSAIGINDRFQYIRELFEGSADNFVKTVADLDSMNDIKEAVNYLQSNFKWKKNETSLKFVNLIKRRFPNE
jgi:hypothetical protein